MARRTRKPGLAWAEGAVKGTHSMKNSCTLIRGSSAVQPRGRGAREGEEEQWESMDT